MISERAEPSNGTRKESPGLVLRRTCSPSAPLRVCLDHEPWYSIDLSFSWSTRSWNGAASTHSPGDPLAGLLRTRSWYVPGFICRFVPVLESAPMSDLYLPQPFLPL